MGIKSSIKKYLYRKLNLSIVVGEDDFIRLGGKLGSDCEIYPNVEFGSEPYLIQIGNHVRITNGVRFVTHDGGVWVLRELGMENIDIFGKITIGNNVHVGWNAIIMPNVHIGNNVVIGAGAVVTKDIPDNSVAVGVPARVIETIDEYREKSSRRGDFVKNLSWNEKKRYLQEKYVQNDSREN